MTEPKILPIFMGEGEEQIQIGEVAVYPWPRATPGYVNLVGNLPVFPGERLTFAKVVPWEEFVATSREMFPKE